MSGFKLQRLGMIMEPEPGNPHEVEGVLNPGAARGPDGELYLFPRMVAKGNYSRIGIARVRFNEAGDPTGVERLGIALEPEADYERRPDGGGGCEDPRVTFVEPLKRYIMTYTAFSPQGQGLPWRNREDLFHWKRLGLATYAHWHGIELGNVDDKDASLFPVAIPDSIRATGTGYAPPAAFSRHSSEETACHPATREVDLDRESIWISYCQCHLKRDPDRPAQFTSHHDWRSPVVALGTAQDRRWNSAHPDQAWLADRLPRCQRNRRCLKRTGIMLCYSAGVMVLLKAASARDPLSLGRAGVDAGASAGTRWDRCQCCFPHGHRPARRSWNSRSLRRLLRDGGQPDWCGAP